MELQGAAIRHLKIVLGEPSLKGSQEKLAVPHTQLSLTRENVAQIMSRIYESTQHQ